MEGPVKERLTGALIFVAALVIIVPEMLSGPEPAATAVPPTATVPADASAPLRTYSVVLNGSAEPGAAQQATLVAQPAAAEPAVEPSAPEPAPAAAAALADAATTQVATAPPVTDSPAVRPGQAKPAVPAESPAGKWWTQLGSFSSHENADRLVRQLRSAGYDMDMSKVSAGGKELYRVRAGPVRSRVEAQTLQARLAAAGHKSSIVAP